MQNKEINHDNDIKIAILENTNGHIQQTLIRIDQRLDKLENKFSTQIDELRKETNNGFADVRKETNNSIAELRRENISHFRWLMSTIIVLTSSPLIIESTKLLIKAFKSA